MSSKVCSTVFPERFLSFPFSYWSIISFAEVIASLIIVFAFSRISSGISASDVVIVNPLFCKYAIPNLKIFPKISTHSDPE